MTTPPKNLSDVHTFDRRVYTWCTKCRRGAGLWVSNHTAATHIDNYRSQRRNQEGQPPKRAHLGTTATPPNIPTVSPPVVEHQDLPEPSTELHGQLSLLDYFDTYLPASPSPPVDDSDLHEF